MEERKMSAVNPVVAHPWFDRLVNYATEVLSLSKKKEKGTISETGEFRLIDLKERIIPDVQNRIQGGILSEEARAW